MSPDSGARPGDAVPGVPEDGTHAADAGNAGGAGWPRYAHRPGRTPHPRRTPAGHAFGMPEPQHTRFDPEDWRSDAAWLRAVALFDAGFTWEAHELFEARWRGTIEPRARALLRALVQLCALELAVEARRERGARALADRAGAVLEELAARTPEFAGLALPRLADAVRARATSVAPLRLRTPSGEGGTGSARG